MSKKLKEIHRNGFILGACMMTIIAAIIILMLLIWFNYEYDRIYNIAMENIHQ